VMEMSRVVINAEYNKTSIHRLVKSVLLKRAN
jgi:hypothetical protein